MQSPSTFTTPQDFESLKALAMWVACPSLYGFGSSNAKFAARNGGEFRLSYQITTVRRVNPDNFVWTETRIFAINEAFPGHTAVPGTDVEVFDLQVKIEGFFCFEAKFFQAEWSGLSEPIATDYIQPQIRDSRG
jgi:hypothetical protein